MVGPEHANTLWVPADGSDGAVVVEGTNDHEVIYTTMDGVTHCTDRTDFSHYYMLAADVDPDDGQPSMYEEYQDLYGGDDNFRDWDG